MAKALPIEQFLTMLAEAPPRIAASIAGLTPAQLRAAPGPGEWSANDVLAHLRACADVWGDSTRRILAEELPTIRGISPRTWINSMDYLDLEFQPSFAAYTAQRADLLALLRTVSPEGWSRQATVTGAGKPFLKTALAYAEGIALHERPHLKQIDRIAAALRGLSADFADYADF